MQEVLRAPRRGDHAQAYTPEPRLSMPADILPDGRFGERWLIVDQTHLRVLTSQERGPALVDLDMPLSEIKEARADTLVGSGVLRLIRRDGQAVEAVRYTLAAAPAFATAARILESWLKEEEPSDSLYAEFDKQKKNCGKCGDPLPEDTKIGRASCRERV